jgi:ketosteroid isomerase-like protein
MPKLNQADTDAIKDISAKVVDIANTKPTDWDSYTETYYTEDAIVLPPNAHAVQGRMAIMEFLKSFPEITKFSNKLVEIGGRDDCAWVYGTYSMTLSPPDAAPMDDVGKYIEVWHKQEDGVWKVTHDIFNSDLT